MAWLIFAVVFLLTLAIYTFWMMWYLGSQSRGCLTILCALAGVWVLPTGIWLVMCAQEDWVRSRVGDWAQDWAQRREHGESSADTRAGSFIFRGRDGFPERGDLYDVLCKIDTEIDCGTVSPAESREKIAELIVQANGVYDPFMALGIGFLLFPSTVFLTGATVCGKFGG